MRRKNFKSRIKAEEAYRKKALEREALKRAVARGKITGPRTAPKAPKSPARPVYGKPPSAPKPPGYGKTPPKPPASRMTRRAKINKEIFDAMNPDGPTNPTRRGTRLANKALRTPTERALARATARATAGVAIGGALLAYDAYKAIDAYSKTSGPKKQMAKYKAKGGFSHMNSNPNKRGKSGVDY